jgi:hypothetical protein
MHLKQLLFPMFLVVVLAMSGWVIDPIAATKKAVENSALDQAGTKSFPPKAEIAPSFHRGFRQDRRRLWL